MILELMMGYGCIYYDLENMYSTVQLVVVTGGGPLPFCFRVICFTLKRHLHALRPGIDKPDRYIACMQAQPVRVIVRLPYNRPEHRQSDPVPVSPPDN